MNIKVMCSTTWPIYVGSMCDCKPCEGLDLSVLVEILLGVEVTMVQVPEGTKVSTQGQQYVQ